MTLYDNYRALVLRGALKADALQERAALRLQALADALTGYRPKGWFRRRGPRGLYIWGDVGRGKSMLMDLFFEAAPTSSKRRIHFNAFMTEVHARIHEYRTVAAADPIPPVAHAMTAGIMLLCFDEFQVTDVADAMILGRLFERLFARGIVIVTTSNTAPENLYEGGLNRQLFMPFVGLLKQKLDIVELNGETDYRLSLRGGLDLYIAPTGPLAHVRMENAWAKLAHGASGSPRALKVFGRDLIVRRAADGVAWFGFDDLCAQPLGAADYLAVARAFHTVLIDGIPRMGPERRDEARRFTLLIDTLYDEGVKLICSAAAPPAGLYPDGDGVEAFRRTVSRLLEMQSAAYWQRGHGAMEPAAHDIP